MEPLGGIVLMRNIPYLSKLSLKIIALFLLIILNFHTASPAYSQDLYKNNLGIINWNGDTTLKGWQRDPGWITHGKSEMLRYENKNDITLFQVQNTITRYGDTAFFIQAPGDECYNRSSDCNRANGEQQKRVEAQTNYGFKGNVWVSYSLYITDEYEINNYNDKSVLQFHSTETYFGPMFMLRVNSEHGFIWVHESAGGHIFVEGGDDNCAAGAGTKKNDEKRTFCEARIDLYQLLPYSDLRRNTWYDFVFNINFDKRDISQAYHKVWLNGELLHERYNQTLWLDQKGIKENLANFNFGIYGSRLDYTYQSIYVDEIHFGRQCKGLALENIGYLCKELESQKIKESVPFYIDVRYK